MRENKCLTSNRAGIVVQIVDPNRCEGRNACVAACPRDVFEVRKIDKADYRNLAFIGKVKNRVHRGMVAHTPNADRRRACGLCLRACPGGAIRLPRAPGAAAGAPEA